MEFEVGLELTFETLRNLSLGEESGDDLNITEQELGFSLGWEPEGPMSALLEAAVVAEQETPRNGPRETERGVERGEMWLRWQRAPEHGPYILAGRQEFSEPRQWWWDDDLDALRVGHASSRSNVWLAVAREIAPESTVDARVDAEEDRVFRVLGEASLSLDRALSVSAFYVAHRDNSETEDIGDTVRSAREDSVDADLDWVGVRTTGRAATHSLGTFAYWADVAWVSGKETIIEFDDEAGTSDVEERVQRDVRGWAVDTGVAWTIPTPLRATVGLSHARTSPDSDTDDSVDRTFRQTGLQDPDTESRIYGELLRPELSNLAVTTLSVRAPILAQSAVAVGYHRFRQVRASATLRETRLESEPTGDSRDIGHEISLVLVLREWEALELELAAARFRAGDAFGALEGAAATSGFLELSVEF